MKLKLNWELILHAVCAAERGYAQGRGDLKRALAVELIVNALPWPRWIPPWFRVWLAGQLVDLSVYVLNWAWGHIWPKDRVNTEALKTLVKEEGK